MANSSSNIIIVVPAFNEVKLIAAVLKSLKKTGFQIIVVDDGSKDRTFNVAANQSVVTLKHRVNLGKGAALKTGCEAAFEMGADAVVMMDSDGQHKVEDMGKFINALESGNYDVVFGSRNLNFGMPLIRFIGNKIASVLVAYLFGIYVSDLLCGYRAITKNAYKKLKWQSVGYGVETEMVVRTGKTGLRYCEVPVETVYYDKFKGVTILDAFGILLNVFRWRIVL